MKINHTISKMLNNRYLLYVMCIVSGLNILGYLVANKLNALFFFALVAVLTYQFSKNMTVVLLVALISTNIVISTRTLEGLENKSDALDKIEDKDPEIAKAIPSVKKAKNGEKIEIDENEVETEDPEDDNNLVDTNNRELNKKTSEKGPDGSNIGKKKKNTSEHFGPRIDYATTIEQSYQHLDEILGSNSIKQLSSDTKNLMKQQQTLFDTMQNMVPVLQGAQNLLKDFKIDGLSDSLKGLNELSKVPLPKN